MNRHTEYVFVQPIKMDFPEKSIKVHFGKYFWSKQTLSIDVVDSLTPRYGSKRDPVRYLLRNDSTEVQVQKCILRLSAQPSKGLNISASLTVSNKLVHPMTV